MLARYGHSNERAEAMETTTDIGSAIMTLLPVIVVLAILGITNTLKVMVYQGKPDTYTAKWFPLVPLVLGILYGSGEFVLTYVPGSLTGIKIAYSVIKEAFGYGGAAAILFNLTKPLFQKIFTTDGKISTAAKAVLLGDVTTNPPDDGGGA